MRFSNLTSFFFFSFENEIYLKTLHDKSRRRQQQQTCLSLY